MANFNSYLSIAVPLAISSNDRKRIAKQIQTVIKTSSPKLALNKARVLDVGSSSGEVASYLAKDVKEIICIDVDKNALKIGKDKFKDIGNLTFRDFNGEDIPYAKSSFDLAILRRTMECIENPQKLLEEIFRVLKPGGLVYFESQNIIWPDTNWDFFAFIPNKLKKIYISFTGKEIYYFAIYRNYWQLKNLFKNFKIYHLTPLVLKNPKKFGFERLDRFSKISKATPLKIFYLGEPILPSFIWVLKK